MFTIRCVHCHPAYHLLHGFQGSCIPQTSPIAHTHTLPKRASKLQRTVAQAGAEGQIPGNPLFANNPQFAAALQSVAARQGDEALFSAPPAVVPEECVALLPMPMHLLAYCIHTSGIECRQTTPHEEMLLTSLQISRRNIRNFESMKQTIEKSIVSEEQQFERLHFAYKKIKSEGAYIKHLEKRLAQEKAKNQGH